MKNHFLVFVFSNAVFFSCRESSNEMTIDKSIIDFAVSVNRDSTAPPVITTLNAPKIIPASGPKSVPLKYPYGIGQPSFVNYTVADGLPQNLLLDVTVDKLGNIWTGGLGFLTKYDGSHFTSYSMANGMGSGFVNRILVRDDNNIWVGNFYDLYKFDGTVFHTTPLSDYDANLDLRHLSQDKKGTIWVSSGKGLFKIVGDSITRFTEKRGLPGEFVRNAYTDKKGRVLASTRKGIYVLEGEDFVYFKDVPIVKEKNPVIVGKDNQENLWFTRAHAHDQYLDLIRYDGKESTIYSVGEGFDATNITAFLEDKNGIFWMTSFGKGLIRFDGERFIYYTTEDGFPSNICYSLTEDDVGNIWITTGNGLAMLSYSYMNSLEKITGGEGFNDLFTIGKDGKKWVVESRPPNNYRLINYGEKEALVYNLDFLNIKTFISSIRTDREGNIWLTSWGNAQPGELIKFDGKSFFIYGKEQGITITNSRKIFEDKESNIWFSGWGGVQKLERESIIHYGTAQGFPENVKLFFIDSKGQYWMTDGDTTICRFDGNNVTFYNKPDGHNSFYISGITEDPIGNIWFAVDKGAILFDGKQFRMYGKMEGMDNLVSGIAFDTSRQLIWFSSISGLTTLPLDKIDSAGFFAKKYSPRNGFGVISSHIQYNQSYFDSLGIWGSSYNGNYRFDYDKVKQFKEPLLQLTNIRIDNQEVLWSNHFKSKERKLDSLRLLNEAVLKFGRPIDASIKKKQALFKHVAFDSLHKDGFIPVDLKLPHKKNSITFQFVTISPSFGKYTQYRYKLEGYQDNWSPYSTKDEAFFGNMKEGKYTFRLQAISSTGAQSELNYSFQVLPPWYRTWWAYSLYALLLITAIYTIIRWRTKALQKEKTILEEKVTTRTSELKESLENLKATQSQLIQSEKMASLGELTAGIAHEIQNPLNFVNNFSEVNKELIEELKGIRHKAEGERDPQLEDELLDDIAQNEDKINHHGKRADAIVKGMLQHSSSGSGKKEPTDINALADEYLRLAYHGLRAKDKSFNATMKTDFDKSIGSINIIPQDMGRVILNLINNAFFAVSERKTLLQAKGDSYEPTVVIATASIQPLQSLSKDGGRIIQIRVSDNGGGIPQKILDKIFQPFFTTKPTGQGTGLGLSLSYDIVKAHGGEIRVETKEGEGTVFLIQLPG